MTAVLAWAYVTVVLAVPAGLIGLASRPGRALRRNYRAWRPAPRSPQAPLVGRRRHRPRLLGPTLACLASLAAAIGGVALRDHYEPLHRLCSSGVGAFVATQQDCNLYGIATDTGLGLAILGALAFVGTGWTLINLWRERQPSGPRSVD